MVHTSHGIILMTDWCATSCTSMAGTGNLDLTVVNQSSSTKQVITEKNLLMEKGAHESLRYFFKALLHSKVRRLKILAFVQNYESPLILACVGQIEMRAGRQAGGYMQ